jgi:hypothetical protein
MVTEALISLLSVTVSISLSQVRRAPNHHRHRHLLRRRGRAPHAPKLCRGKVVLFLAATIGSGCGFVCGGGGGEGGEQEGRDGGFAASGLEGSVSEMGWWNWLLGLLHFLCSPIDEAFAASTGMVSIHCEPQREKVCVFRVYETVSFPFVFLLVSFHLFCFKKNSI